MSSDPISDALLAGYLGGECTPDEANAVSAWAAADPSNARRLVMLRRAWDGSKPTYGDAIPAAETDRFIKDWRQAADAPMVVAAARRDAVMHTARTRRWPSYAAGASLVALVLGFIFLQGKPTVVPASPARTYATTAGQRARVTLADGTRVMLAPNTSLVVGHRFGDDSRTVTLTGEAQFDVTANGGAPFIVRAGDVHTRVLGTTFTVRRYDGDPTARVVVTSGKVAVSMARRAPVTLTSGMMGEMRDSSVSVSAVSNMALYTGWTSGQLVFDNAPVPTMLATVGRWYDYTFVLADSSIATRHVTAVFKIASQAETMAAIKHLLGVTMTFDGKTVTLRRSGATGQPAMTRLQGVRTLSSTTRVGK